MPRYSEQFKRSRLSQSRANAAAASDAERIRRMDKEIAKLREECDIVRKAAKYFAEETHW